MKENSVKAKSAERAQGEVRRIPILGTSVNSVGGWVKSFLLPIIAIALKPLRLSTIVKPCNHAKQPY